MKTAWLATGAAAFGLLAGATVSGTLGDVHISRAGGSANQPRALEAMDSTSNATLAPTDSAIIAGLGQPSMPGEDRPVVRRYEGRSHYVLDYPKYVVAVSSVRDEPGDTARVFLKQSSQKGTPNAATESAPAIITVAQEEGWFFGLAGDYLFIESGCCPGPRGLTVYDLTKRARWFEGAWLLHEQGTPSLRDGRWLTYWEPIKAPSPKPPCPEVDSLLSHSGVDLKSDERDDRVAYEELVVLDLRRRVKTRTGRIECSYRE